MPRTIRVEQRQGVATITMRRPDRLNALDVPSLRSLRVALQEVAVDPGVRAVLLTGAGRAFCAGGDLGSMEYYLRRRQLPRLFHLLTAEQELAAREVVEMPKPVVAALPGVAAGGGLSLALSADWRIASREAFLYPAFPALGAVPDGGLTYFLPHYLGMGLAQELLLSNPRLPADRAKELGLVHEVVDPERLKARAWERTLELARGPTFALAWMKRLLRSAFTQPLETQLALERRGAVEAARGSELPEGIRAFREHRPPQFAPPAPTSPAARKPRPQARGRPQ